MPILKEVKPAASHRCVPPKSLEQYGIGTIWGCDVCGKQASLERDRDGSLLWQWMLEKDYIEKQ